MEREIFKNISYGMYVVTSSSDVKNCGCIINTLTQITSEDPLISISLNKSNYTNKIIKKTNRFCVSIISTTTNPNLISTFGFKSSLDFDKFGSFDYEIIDNLPILKENMIGYLICEVTNIIDCNTHDLIIAKVINCKLENKIEAMTYSYYHNVIKGKAPKAAPTYIEEKKENSFVCDVCGYVHTGDLPEGFRCPICGVDESHFKKQ